jgi:ferrous iron transport protein B
MQFSLDRFLLKKVTTTQILAPENAWIAVVGNPNCGKTALFNELTGMHLRVGNYPGVTVEKKTGFINIGEHRVEITDLPGTYSLSPQSIDEEIVTNLLHESILFRRLPKAIIIVIDATNLERNLFLAMQIIELGIPVIVSLNMIDLLHQKGQDIDAAALQRSLGVMSVIPTVAKKGRGITDIRKALGAILDASGNLSKAAPLELPAFLEKESAKVFSWFHRHLQLDAPVQNSLVLQMISNSEVFHSFLNTLRKHHERLNLDKETILTLYLDIKDVKQSLQKKGVIPHSIESKMRYMLIDDIVKASLIRERDPLSDISERADKILTHKYFGMMIFVLILSVIFQAVFSLAEYPMNAIDDLFVWLGGLVDTTMADGLLKELITDGVLAGIGGVVIFLPQILILTAFLGILEDTGYMARAAFLMDKMFHRIGLSGRSVVPLLNGYACAIPAIMGTRTIKNWEDRLITILIIPLMSCSARLPLYVLLIGAFIPKGFIFGFIPMQGFTLLLMYLLGTMAAVIMAWVLKTFLIKPKRNYFLMEMPAYHWPHWRSIFWQVYEKGKSFIATAGQIILAISIILWFLAAFPKDANGQSNIETSYAAAIGKTIEPAIEPLGFDWKIGIGLVTSFAAREVIISTLATIYKVDSEAEQPLIESLKNDVNPKTGLPVFNIITVLSLLVFYVFAAQCMATFAIIKKETHSWRWPVFMVVYMTAIAYFAALVVNQAGMMLYG